MASQTVSVHHTGGVRIRRRARLRRLGLGCMLVSAFAGMWWAAWWEYREPRNPRDTAQPLIPHDVKPADGAQNPSMSAPAAPVESPFEVMLREGDYNAAVEQYARTYTQGSAATAHQYRETLLRQVSRFIQNGRYADATALLDAYLAVFYRDTEALVYAGRAYRENRQYRAAIEAFLRAAQQDQHPDKLRTVNGQLSWTINLYVQALREAGRHEELVDLYSYLTQANPRNPYYFIALARAYLAVGRIDDALAALQYVAAEGEAGREAQELIEEIRAGL